MQEEKSHRLKNGKEILESFQNGGRKGTVECEYKMEAGHAKTDTMRHNFFLYSSPAAISEITKAHVLYSPPPINGR